jgi:hypothetical protein
MFAVLLLILPIASSSILIISFCFYCSTVMGPVLSMTCGVRTAAGLATISFCMSMQSMGLFFLWFSGRYGLKRGEGGDMLIVIPLASWLSLSKMLAYFPVNGVNIPVKVVEVFLSVDWYDYVCFDIP